MHYKNGYDLGKPFVISSIVRVLRHRAAER